MNDDINFCACMGPRYDEPYCYCEMKRRGLPLNEPARKEAEQCLKEAMDRMFGKEGT